MNNRNLSAHDIDPTKLSDKDLYKLCQKYGGKARKCIKYFASLLPEVMKRRLHRKYGFSSIYEFAAKLCGMSAAAVDEVLRVNEKLKDMPILKSKLKTHGWSKLRVVAGIANKENERLLAEQVEKLSKSALEEYVREMRIQFPEIASEKPENLFAKPESGVEENFGEFRDSGKTGYKKKFSRIDFNIDKETEFELRKLKHELEKERKVALTLGETLKELIEQAKELKELKKRLQENLKIQKHKKRKKINLQSSRHIPQDIRRGIERKYKGKCAFPGCNKPAVELHHAERFALSQSHEKLYPLCKMHHELVHASLIANEDQSPKYWKLLREPVRDGPRFDIDRLVQKNKKFAL